MNTEENSLGGVTRTVGHGATLGRARTFTARERGQVKHVFSKRKIFWDKVRELVRSGDTAFSAIDKIYDAYGGGEPVTTYFKNDAERQADWWWSSTTTCIIINNS